MMNWSRKLQDLPNELLIECFQYLGSPDLVNARFASQRCYAAATTQVSLTRLRVAFTSQSLGFLEHIAAHTRFSKTLEEIHFDVSFFDGTLAESFTVFQRVNLVRRYIEDDDARRQLAPDIFDEVQNHIAPSKSHRRTGILTRQAHAEYSRRYLDQQAVQASNQHINRLTAALRNFPALKTVRIQDEFERWPLPELYPWRGPFKADLQGDETVYDICLQPRFWYEKPTPFHCPHEPMCYREVPTPEPLLPLETTCGSNKSRRPPVHLIADICSAIVASGVRIKKMDIRLHCPEYLECLQLNADQLEAVARVGRLLDGRERSLTVYDWRGRRYWSLGRRLGDEEGNGMIRAWTPIAEALGTKVEVTWLSRAEWIPTNPVGYVN